MVLQKVNISLPLYIKLYDMCEINVEILYEVNVICAGVGVNREI